VTQDERLVGLARKYRGLRDLSEWNPFDNDLAADDVPAVTCTKWILLLARCPVRLCGRTLALCRAP
jgi:hypothetical protein